MTRRKCPRCGVEKLATEFHTRQPRQGWIDDTGQARHSYCRVCESARLKEWRERDVENARALSRAAYAKRMKRVNRNRQTREAHLERRRLEAWERRRKLGQRERLLGGQKAPDTETDLRLPREPFVEWLRRKREEYGDWLAVANVTGVQERTIQRLINGLDQTRVSIDTVDAALIREGSTFLFQLYPELYPSLDAAPDLMDLLADVCLPAPNYDALPIRNEVAA